MPPKNRNRNHVRFNEQTAVEEEESSGRPTAVADDVDGDSDSVCHSVAGDTVGSEPDDSTGEPKADDRYCWPKTPVRGNAWASTERGPSSKYNNEPEVGNMGLMCGSVAIGGRDPHWAANAHRDDDSRSKIANSCRALRKCWLLWSPLGS